MLAIWIDLGGMVFQLIFLGLNIFIMFRTRKLVRRWIASSKENKDRVWRAADKLKASADDLMRREIMFQAKCHALGIMVEIEEINPDETPATRH